MNALLQALEYAKFEEKPMASSLQFRKPENKWEQISIIGEYVKRWGNGHIHSALIYVKYNGKIQYVDFTNKQVSLHKITELCFNNNIESLKGHWLAVEKHPIYGFLKWTVKLNQNLLFKGKM